MNVSSGTPGVTGFTVSADPNVPSQVHTFEVVATSGGLRRTAQVQVQTASTPPPTPSRSMTIYGCAGYTNGTLNPDSLAAFHSTFVGAWKGGWGESAGGSFCTQTLGEADGFFVLDVPRGCISQGDSIYLTSGGLTTCVRPSFEAGSTAHVTLLGRLGDNCP